MVMVSRVLNVTTVACLPMLYLLQMLLIINLEVASGKPHLHLHFLFFEFSCFDVWVWRRKCNNDAHWVASLGQCLPCMSLRNLKCMIDSVPSQCDNGDYYCLQCHANEAADALLPFQVWQASSTAPYSTRLPYCTPVCAPGKTTHNTTIVFSMIGS